jgi:hypothetical protein
MRYVMVIHETPANLAERAAGADSAYVPAWRSYYQVLLAAGAYVGGAPLKDAATATTVRVRDGKRHVQDGPFAEAKEELGGFMIVEAPSLDAALEWAARCPAAASGALEVRPMDVGIHDTIVAP